MSLVKDAPLDNTAVGFFLQDLPLRLGSFDSKKNLDGFQVVSDWAMMRVTTMRLRGTLMELPPSFFNAVRVDRDQEQQHYSTVRIRRVDTGVATLKLSIDILDTVL